MSSSKYPFLAQLGIEDVNPGAAAGPFFQTQGAELESRSPCDGELIARVRQATRADTEAVIAKAEQAFHVWRQVPAPKRGEVVRQIAEELRKHKEPLGKLVSLEMGKIYQEGLGEVQEMIDIADFAVGLSRQLYGNSMHSERPQHRMYEQWHPLGPVGIITAFNFPVAVWAWNAMLAMVCGDTCIWKPSELVPLCAVAVQRIAQDVLARNGYPDGVTNLLIGSLEDVAQPLVEDPRLPLISATGSTAMGKKVGPVVAGRLGRVLLELGGNNAIVVRESADLDLTLRAILFGAVGTAGQRCTTTRRVLAHPKVLPALTERLIAAYKQVPIGDPLKPGTLVGPLINEQAVQGYEQALEQIRTQGGEVLTGGKRYGEGACAKGHFVEPTLVRATKDMPIVKQETFAPILYLIEVEGLDDVIAAHNDVPQGLSSAIFTRDLQEAERFLSAVGSDCGIANVNIGTSGAEIGGAFGGEKETGGGREAGSDSWKAYMRRQTCTINYSSELPLAQGIEFPAV